jgi:hypothetical protein
MGSICQEILIVQNLNEYLLHCVLLKDIIPQNLIIIAMITNLCHKPTKFVIGSSDS